MAEIRKEWKRHLFEKNPMRCLLLDAILSYLGFAFMLIGIIGDAMNKVLGLESTNWLILAVGFWLMAFGAWFRGYYSALHHSEDATEQRED